MNSQNVKQHIRSFLADTNQEWEVEDDQDIFENGFGNSLLAIQLVEFVEREFSIVVEGDDLAIENFRSISDIAALVHSKQVVA